MSRYMHIIRDLGVRGHCEMACLRDSCSPGITRILLCCMVLAIGFDPAPGSAQALGCKLTTRPGPPAIEILTCDGLKIEAETATDVKVSNGAGGPSPDSARVQGGAALVTVTPGRRTPFQILTPRAIASVRGTRYAVDDAPDKTSVFVERGTVQVARASGGSAVTLRAGDGVDVREGADALSVQRWSRVRVRGLMARFGR